MVVLAYHHPIVGHWQLQQLQVFLIGGFNDWSNSTPLTNEGFGRWSLFIKDKAGRSSRSSETAGILKRRGGEENVVLLGLGGCFGWVFCLVGCIVLVGWWVLGLLGWGLLQLERLMVHLESLIPRS